MNLLDSDVLVKSIFGFNDHELIYVIMFDFVIYEICLLVVLMALHSSSDLSRAWNDVLWSTIDVVRVVWLDVFVIRVSF